MGEGRGALKMLTSTFTGKRPLGRPRCRWEDNIRMDLNKIGMNTRNLVDLAQDRNYWRATPECGIEPPDSIIHGVSEIHFTMQNLHSPEYLSEDFWCHVHHH
jgi:hypothetical protein